MLLMPTFIGVISSADVTMVSLDSPQSPMMQRPSYRFVHNPARQMMMEPQAPSPRSQTPQQPPAHHQEQQQDHVPLTRTYAQVVSEHRPQPLYRASLPQSQPQLNQASLPQSQPQLNQANTSLSLIFIARPFVITMILSIVENMLYTV